LGCLRWLGLSSVLTLYVIFYSLHLICKCNGRQGVQYMYTNSGVAFQFYSIN